MKIDTASTCRLERLAYGAVAGLLLVLFSTPAHAQCLLQRVLPPADATGEMGTAIDYSQGRMIVGDSSDDTLGNGQGCAYIYRLVDGQWTFEAQLLPLPDTGLRFGAAVAISGVFAVMGHSFHGGAHVYELIDGVWEHVAHLTGPTNLRLGRGVAISGTTILASDLLEETKSGHGAVYVFERIDGAWQFQTKLISPLVNKPPGIFDQFGQLLHFDGTNAIVAAWSRAHVFERKGSTWTPSATVLFPNGGTDTPTSVVVDGNRAVIGVASEDTYGMNAGALYVYEKSGVNWVLDETIAPPAGMAEGEFGTHADLRNDHLITTSHIATAEGTTSVLEHFTRDGDHWVHQNSVLQNDVSSPVMVESVALLPQGFAAGIPDKEPHGTVNVFGEKGQQWTEDQMIMEEEVGEDHQFGYSIATDDETLVVTAASPTTSSSTYVYRRTGMHYIFEQQLEPPPGAISVGIGLAIDGDRLAVAALVIDDQPKEYISDVAIYRRINGEWVHEGTVSSPIPLTGHISLFGHALAWADDQLLVGDGLHADNDDFPGAVYVYAQQNGTWQLTGEFPRPPNGHLGNWGDFLASSSGVAACGAITDQCHIYVRNGDSWLHSQTITVADAVDSIAANVAMTDDTIAVGTPSISRVHILRRVGDTKQWTISQVLVDPSFDDESMFGWSIAINEHLLLIGATFDAISSGGSLESAAHVYKFRKGAWQHAAKLQPSDPDDDNGFAFSAALFDDGAVVSAPWRGQPFHDSGAVYVFNLEEFCPGDPTDDGVIDELDRALLCDAMGSSAGDASYHPAVDFNDDATVNHLDLAHFNALTPGLCHADLAHTNDFQLPGDHVIDGVDLAILLGAWGDEPSCADLVDAKSFQPPPDGAVDGADLAYLLGAWGPCD